MKVGRNQPCPCGSGKKYKRCHGSPRDQEDQLAKRASNMLAAHRAKEKMRVDQQGAGKPIISAQMKDHRVVAVGNTIYYSPRWKTFVDFLSHYIKTKLQPEWGSAELLKPLEERHPIMQWHEALCRYQAAHISTPGEINETPITGVVACYFSLAYALYLLNHNVELQDRLLARLKNQANFQGAYYETLVASALIRAGFELTLEDETDGSEKHCEFAAVSKQTGRKYWVEAKMRAVAGVLGKTDADGATAKSEDEASKVVPHLRAALQKPAADERLIFIDLNARLPDSVSEDGLSFFQRAIAKLERFERCELEEGQSAYVFLTNFDFHRELEAAPKIAAYPFGLGIPDFNKPGAYRLPEIYDRNRRHADALAIGKSLERFLNFPTTFDGSLPSGSLFGQRGPVQVGETYLFEGANQDGSDLLGQVTSAIVDEAKSTAIIAVYCPDGTAHLLTETMTEAQIADYKAHPDSYFGKLQPPPRKAETPYELFEFLMESFEGMTKEQIIERMGETAPTNWQELDGEELLKIYCEGLVHASGAFPRSGDVSGPRDMHAKPVAKKAGSRAARPEGKPYPPSAR